MKVKTATMKIKTATLTKCALDWAAAKCEGYGDDGYMKAIDLRYNTHGKVSAMLVPIDREYVRWSPSTDRNQGGQILERQHISTVWAGFGLWEAWDDQKISPGMPPKKYTGPTPLIAGMRCHVARCKGEEIDIPDRLLSMPVAAEPDDICLPAPGG